MEIELKFTKKEIDLLKDIMSERKKEIDRLNEKIYDAQIDLYNQKIKLEKDKENE